MQEKLEAISYEENNERVRRTCTEFNFYQIFVNFYTTAAADKNKKKPGLMVSPSPRSSSNTKKTGLMVSLFSTVVFKHNTYMQPKTPILFGNPFHNQYLIHKWKQSLDRVTFNIMVILVSKNKMKILKRSACHVPFPLCNFNDSIATLNYFSQT